MNERVYGVDLGGTTVKIGAFDGAGTLVRKWEIPTRSENGGALILEDIAASVKADAVENEAVIGGIGMGVPGVITPDGDLLPCVNLNGWGGAVGKELSQRCGCPVKMLNDANAATLGELWRGGGMGVKSMVFVTLGTGVGGGIVVDGKLLAGSHGVGGELGHMKIYETGEDVCGCGKRGCLEKYASATALATHAKRAMAQTDAPSALRNVVDVTAKDVFDAAKTGDTLAVELCEKYADALGRGLAIVACVCDPEAFVLGGGVTKAGDYLLNKVKEAYQRYAFATTAEADLVLAKLGNDAGMYGGAHEIFAELGRTDLL